MHSLEYKDILTQIKGLMASGELQAGYELAQVHAQQDDVIALTYAQLALLLGNEKEANLIFLSLQGSQQLTSLQKKNMNAFIKRFQLTLEKKIKLAKQIVKKGECEPIEAQLRSLRNYQTTRNQVKKLLAECEQDWRDNVIRLGASYGFDNNISLTNEDFSGNNVERIEGGYQSWNFMLKSKPINKMSAKTSDFSWLTSYFYSAREYDQQVPSRYDYSSHKVQAEFRRKNWLGLDWSIPFYFRYLEYSGQHYNNSIGTKLGMSYRSKQFQQKLTLHWRHKSYAKRVDYNRNSDLIDLGYRGLYRVKPFRYQAQLNYQALTGPKDTSDQYKALNLGVKASYHFANIGDMKLQPHSFLSYSTKLKQYQAVDAGLVNTLGTEYDRKREDVRQEYQLGLVVKYRAWRLKSQYQYQQRASNLDVYNFQRHKLEVGLQYEF